MRCGRRCRAFPIPTNDVGRREARRYPLLDGVLWRHHHDRPRIATTSPGPPSSSLVSHPPTMNHDPPLRVRSESVLSPFRLRCHPPSYKDFYALSESARVRVKSVWNPFEVRFHSVVAAGRLSTGRRVPSLIVLAVGSRIRRHGCGADHTRQTLCEVAWRRGDAGRLTLAPGTGDRGPKWGVERS